MWWVKSGPNPVPLVSGNADPTTIGSLADPGTRILFGGRGLDYGTLSGVRATVGGWLDQDGRFGLEASGFLLERGATGFRASSPGAPGPVVSIPFNALAPFGTPPLNPPGETALNAGGGPNTVTALSTTRLWGAEANALANLARDDRFRVDALAGFRYLDLQEGLGLRDVFPDAVTGGTVTVGDSFSTRNQFYGGQLGARFGTTFRGFTLDATAKAALGWTHESVNVLGLSTVTSGAFGFPTGTFAGGVFGNPSNGGRSTHDHFAVVPEAQVRLGYQITRRLQGFVGYNFLYISDVVRPGDQINRNINPTQNVLFGGTGGALTGPAAPPPPFNRTDFWAHGVSFGLALRF
jgi:hypothetical protein